MQTQNTRARYLDAFIRLRCAPDLLARRLFPNSKEVAESMSAYDAVVEHVLGAKPKQASHRATGQLHLDGPRFASFALDDEDVTCVVVGDGASPRTGALFAMRSKWNVISVDPRLRPRTWDVDRLTCIAARIEDVPPVRTKRAVIVAVHSHAGLLPSIRAVDASELHIVAIPCCTPQWSGRVPDKVFRDDDMMTAKNEVLVWRWVNLGAEERTAA